MKKRYLLGLLAIVLSVFVSSCTTNVKSDAAYTIENNMIVFPEPERVEGQKSVLQLAVDPIPVVRMGFIGLGMRGADAVNRISNIEGVEFKALCDLLPERVEAVQDWVIKGKGLPECAEYRLVCAYCGACKQKKTFVRKIGVSSYRAILYAFLSSEFLYAF
jgi:hypothetical protein